MPESNISIEVTQLNQMITQLQTKDVEPTTITQNLASTVYMGNLIHSKNCLYKYKEKIKYFAKSKSKDRKKTLNLCLKLLDDHDSLVSKNLELMSFGEKLINRAKLINPQTNALCYQNYLKLTQSINDLSAHIALLAKFILNVVNLKNSIDNNTH
ncbi:hypothetical protein AB837_00076 [bacterium AB1]|nr:hypothetical protein AB837_00076 [bacterium AB1]